MIARAYRQENWPCPPSLRGDLPRLRAGASSARRPEGGTGAKRMGVGRLSGLYLHRMSITATGGAEAAPPADSAHGHAQGPLYKLAIGAIGIVFGDIGTSPIYSFRETFAGHHPLSPDQFHIYAVLSTDLLVDDDRRHAEICDDHHAGGQQGRRRKPRAARAHQPHASAARRNGRTGSSCSACSRPRSSTAIR